MPRSRIHSTVRAWRLSVPGALRASAYDHDALASATAATTTAAYTKRRGHEVRIRGDPASTTPSSVPAPAGADVVVTAPRAAAKVRPVGDSEYTSPERPRRRSSSGSATSAPVA